MNHVPKLFAGDELDARVPPREGFGGFVKYSTADEDPARRAMVFDYSQELPQGYFVHPAIAVMLALNQDSLAILLHHEVSTAIWPSASDMFDVVTERLIVGPNKLFEFSP